VSVDIMGGSITDRNRLDHELHEIGWGLLIALTGVIWLVPSELVPEGAWLFGVAAILLGINAIRYAKHIPLNGFSLLLGFAALVAGFTRFWRTDLPLLAICLIVIGGALVAKPFVTKHE
jgi:hypothetical protein